MKKIFLIILSSLFVFTSCDKVTEPEIDGVEIQEMCGEWFVETFVGESKVADYSLITTYNTAKNNDSEMWIDDQKNIWEFKSVTPINLSNKSFGSTDSLESIYYPLNVIISNGKMMDDAATTSGGNKSDSIYLDIVFGDDPATTYTIKGYKRTGFLEDEH